jgi:hypothetical protein
VLYEHIKSSKAYAQNKLENGNSPLKSRSSEIDKVENLYSVSFLSISEIFLQCNQIQSEELKRATMELASDDLFINILSGLHYLNIEVFIYINFCIL